MSSGSSSADVRGDGLRSIEIPAGWSDSRNDRNNELHFKGGEVVSNVIGARGIQLKPIITDNGETYVFSIEREGKEEFYVWNYISGTVMKVKGDGWDAKSVVDTIGLSILMLDMEVVGTT